MTRLVATVMARLSAEQYQGQQLETLADDYAHLLTQLLTPDDISGVDSR